MYRKEIIELIKWMHRIPRLKRFPTNQSFSDAVMNIVLDEFLGLREDGVRIFHSPRDPYHWASPCSRDVEEAQDMKKEMRAALVALRESDRWRNNGHSLVKRRDPWDDWRDEPYRMIPKESFVRQYLATHPEHYRFEEALLFAWGKGEGRKFVFLGPRTQPRYSAA